MDEVKKINAKDIDDPVNPMRTEVDRERIFELAESIAREGLINPITVRPKGDRYEVVAGHRRFLGCKIANIIDIPCVVRDLTDEAAQEVMAHENLFREDIDPVDEALFLGRLIGDNDEGIKQAAEKLNRSVEWVRSRLEILSFPDYMLEALRSGELKLGVASWLGRIGDEFWRKQYVENAVRQGMSVVQSRYLHDQWSMGVTPASADLFEQVAQASNSAPPLVKVACAACGKVAIEPNLQSVLVHKECPSNGGAEGEGQKSDAPPPPSSATKEPDAPRR